MEMMEFFKVSHVQSMFAQLGHFVGKKYVPSDNCYGVLMHIYGKLITEDTISRNFRLNIGVAQIVKKDIIPILIAVENNNILELLIKILANIMTPVECLVQIEQLNKEEIDCSTILKLNWLLTTSKIACVDLNPMKRILQVVKENSTKSSCCKGSSSNYITAITDCLRLIKNILHVPDDKYQNQILWMLYCEKFDEILIELIGNANRRQWAILIIEIIALMFKNQHVDHMAKLLSDMNDTLNSDSSEDNESNTSPHSVKNETMFFRAEIESVNSDKNDIDQQSNEIILSPTKPIQSEFNEKPHDINTMNDRDKNRLDLLAQLPILNDELDTKSVLKEPTSLCNIKWKDNNEVTELNEKYLIKNSEQENTAQKSTTLSSIGSRKTKLRMRKKTKKNLISELNLNILPKHISCEKHISYFLWRFTVRFLRYGFNTLVDEVYKLLISNSHQYIDTSLYFWILTYFCRFCKLNQIKLKLVRRIVSFKLISYIVYESAKISEQLMIAKYQKSHNIHLQVRKLHLVIMAIKEIINAIEFYRQTSAKSPIYLQFIKDFKRDNLTESFAWVKDLKSIFTLLIRHYDSSIQDIGYLHDLIVTNHVVLLLFDNLKDYWNLYDDISAHIKKFAACDLMFNYGRVLQNYKTNDALVNEAVFTMMHHINGEVENTTVLYQPMILKTFLNIYEERDYLFERWSDLIECVINKFLNLPQTELCQKYICKN